jgi:hypothetical protein
VSLSAAELRLRLCGAVPLSAHDRRVRESRQIPQSRFLEVRIY